MIGRNDPCWCGSGAKWKKCHFPEKSPNSEQDKLARTYLNNYDILLKTDEQIAGIRAACKLSADVLTATSEQAKAGVSTQFLNDYAHRMITKAGATAAALLYGHPPFPKSICISLNEVICHGIADEKTILQEGDILNIDVACILNGYYGDCSRMVVIGKTTEERQRVVDVSYDCLMQSIEPLKPGSLVSDIGDIIESHAEKNNCSVVYQFVGHGVGVRFHEGPQVPHCRNSLDIALVPGMTFTIEPMINAGVPEAVINPKDQWTATTADNKASAQWEHTILITDDGHEILTTWQR